jgi:hypothetical protein
MSRWLVLVSFLAVTITVSAGPARAEQPAAPPPPPVDGATAQPLPPGTTPPGATPFALPAPPPAPMTRTKRYPLAVMVADAAWALAAYRLDSPYLAMGGYIGAAPLAHAMMGNTRGALISGGLRATALAVTVVGALTIGRKQDCLEECDEEPGPLVYAGLIGAGVVVLVDWLVLAKKEVPVAAPMQARSAPDWAVTPQVQVGQGGLQVGLGGWF